jgi:Ca-activated chloride channel family protein
MWRKKDQARRERGRRICAIFLLLGALGAPAGDLPSARGQSGRSPRTSERSPKQDPPKTAPPIHEPRENAAERAETIRISSDLVTIVTSVSRPGGTPIEQLTREDFEILEDGQPQEIADFARDTDLPLRLVMLFDTSLSVTARLEFERRASARFFERIMRPKDQAALISFSTDVMVMQDFTSRVPALIDALRQLRARGATSLYDAIYLGAEYIKNAPGRHIIVIVSDGGDTTSRKDLKTALAQAHQADAVIYAIYTGNIYNSQNLRDLAAERALAALAAETGGEVFGPKPDEDSTDAEADEQALLELNYAFTALAEQLRTQYTLGFYSTNEARDGRFRKLTVRIKKPGYAARSRAGYYAPKS